jgi:hypothetical protein
MGHTPEGVDISPRGVAQGGRSQPPRINTGDSLCDQNASAYEYAQEQSASMSCVCQ